MDIDHPILIFFDHLRRDHHKKTCQHNKIRLIAVHSLQQLFVEISRVSKSFGDTHTDGISFSSARFSAYAFLLLLITPTICVFVIVPSFTLSMIACRFVPPPDTITTTRSGLSAAAPVLSSIILLLCLLPQCVPTTYGASPAARIASMARSASASSTATIMPSPILNVLYIICSAISPSTESILKIGGIG